MEIRKSEFNPENYSKLSLLKTQKNGNEIYSFETACDRCNGLGYVISHVENGKPVLMRPEGGICFKCRGSKVMTLKLKVITDEEMNAKEAKARKDAEEYKKHAEELRQEEIKHSLELGYKLVDFKVAGWFFGKCEDKDYNVGKYYIIAKETEKAVCISFKESLDSGFIDEQWFPKKAIIK